MSEVNQKLFEIEDPLLRNQTGVSLYGTMWEDMGEKAVLSLTNIQDHVAGAQ